MRPLYVTESFIENFIARAITEDIGEGDHSTLATIPEGQKGIANLILKENGILAGLELAREIFQRIDAALQCTFYKNDGESANTGDVVLTLYGPVRSILGSERLVLNCIQRMSGIATETNSMCAMLEGTHAKLLDTRKTTPTLRPLEKWAVLIGGGTNHRFALYDMIMLKDNHVDFTGGIIPALKAARNYLDAIGKDLKIEIETRSLAEVNEASDCGLADIIMLDNMDISTMKAAVDMICGRVKTEASGGITKENLREIALTGVDYISVGALTHSVKSLDMSLKAEIAK